MESDFCIDKGQPDCQDSALPETWASTRIRLLTLPVRDSGVEETDQVSPTEEQCDLGEEIVGNPCMAEMEEWGLKKNF